MDPYIECQGNWPDFHSRLIAEACNALGVHLPDNYVPRVDERIEVVNLDGPDGTSYRPDVLVPRREIPVTAGRPSAGAVSTIKPIWTLRDCLPAIPIPLRPPDADVSIDLQELVGRVYDLGRYGRTLRHDQPLPQGLLLDPKDRAWAEGIGQVS